MHFMITGRQGGKTNRILSRFVNDDDTIIVTHDSTQIKQLATAANIMNPKYSVEEYARRIFPPQSNYIRGGNGKILVDNVDLILQHVYGGRVDFVTGTGSYES